MLGLLAAPARALLAAGAPSTALAASPLRPRAAPLLMAKKKKKKPAGGDVPASGDAPARRAPPAPAPTSAPAAAMPVTLTVPEGFQAGDSFNFRVDDGREFTLTVPEGVASGQQLAVEIPVAAAPIDAPSTPVPEVPFPMLVPETPTTPPSSSASRAPSRYAQGLDLPMEDVDVEIPDADLGLLARVQEAPVQNLPSFNDYLRKRGASPWHCD